MKRLVTIFRAFLAAGLDYPDLARQGRAWPRLDGLPADTWTRIAEPGREAHDLKNLATEIVRANAQWAVKFFCFAILWLAAAVAALAAGLIVFVIV